MPTIQKFVTYLRFVALSYNVQKFLKNHINTVPYITQMYKKRGINRITCISRSTVIEDKVKCTFLRPFHESLRCK